MEVVLLLISDFNCDPNVRGNLSQSILQRSCDKGSVSLIKALIQEHKADINAQDDLSYTPLSEAAYQGNHEVALSFIEEFGCNPKVKSNLGKSLLHDACWGGSVRLVCTLIQNYKAVVNARDDDGYTPLHLAARNGKAEVALCLITEFGDDVRTKGYLGKSLLHCACEGGSVHLVEYLIHSLSVLCTDDEGNTPLHICSGHGHAECVQILLSSNAPVLIRNRNGNTPLEVAKGRARSFLEWHLREHSNKLQIDYNAVLELARKHYSGAKEITRMFVLGNPGAGKSSLVEALKKEGFFESFRRVSESSVPLHTAGIVPSIYTSKNYGRSVFFDFAGDPEYYSSHAAILENLASSKTGDNVIVLVVNMNDDEVSIDNTLHYWLSFIQYQKFVIKVSFIIVGSHLDLLIGSQALERRRSIQTFATTVSPTSAVFLDCCKPRSSGMKDIRRKISTLMRQSRLHTISNEASLLLGLFEKDFNTVIACSVQTILSHIKDSGACLPNKAKDLYLPLSELHDVGILLLLGDRNSDDCYVVLKFSKLTNEVHKLLFSKSATESLHKKYSRVHTFNIGVLPDNVLKEILPPYITKQCLSCLQYCQEIKAEDINVFPSFTHSDSTDQCFLFFPALCSVDKSEVSWVTPPDLSYSIGWLARCTDPFDYFPPRFLHVLLLRLVFRFTLSASSQNQALVASLCDHSHFQRLCTMWKTGVYWSMEEGVECMVELVNGNKEVVITTKSQSDWSDICTVVFSRIIGCVMEAKAEFCQSIKLNFYLLDCKDGASYLCDDHLFAMSNVERALANPEGKNVIISMSGKRHMELSKLLSLRILTHWHSLFPIDFLSIHHLLKNVVDKVYDLGLELKVPYHTLEALETNFPTDVVKRRREMVKGWMSSTHHPPCWWHLVQALKRIGMNALAEEIQEEHSKSA